MMKQIHIRTFLISAEALLVEGWVEIEHQFLAEVRGDHHRKQTSGCLWGTQRMGRHIKQIVRQHLFRQYCPERQQPVFRLSQYFIPKADIRWVMNFVTHDLVGAGGALPGAVFSGS